ncbi:hypothetical protein BaRGS_00034108 [Batillaria attramentaria]|uniref:Uncharacterized protein n=1 Tax=Batillaria attramentaria TaxID=370345 RepID=A0ABD0JIG2_9CAEN
MPRKVLRGAPVDKHHIHDKKRAARKACQTQSPKLRGGGQNSPPKHKFPWQQNIQHVLRVLCVQHCMCTISDNASHPHHQLQQHLTSTSPALTTSHIHITNSDNASRLHQQLRQCLTSTSTTPTMPHIYITNSDNISHPHQQLRRRLTSTSSTPTTPHDQQM